MNRTRRKAIKMAKRRLAQIATAFWTADPSALKRQEWKYLPADLVWDEARDVTPEDWRRLAELCRTQPVGPTIVLSTTETRWPHITDGRS